MSLTGSRCGLCNDRLSDAARKDALKNLRFTAFLLIFAGYYFMAEQFYMTFPQYVTRHIDKKAPLDEPLTLAGAEGKSYGGFNFRFGPRKKTTISVPENSTLLAR